MKRFRIVVFILWSSSCLFSGINNTPKPETAIIGAFKTEVELIKAEMTEKKTITLLEIPYITGKLKGRAVVLCETGVGKVNAAVTTSLLLYYFKPQEVIFTGIGGALHPKVSPADIVIGRRCVQHDYGDVWEDKGFVAEGPRHPRTGINIPLFLQADERLLTLSLKAAKMTTFEKIKTKTGYRLPKIIPGTILTGDIFVAAKKRMAELSKRYQGDLVEMEGAAVGQVCYLSEVPFIVIRSASDAGGVNVGQDFHRFYKVAAHNSSRLVMKMIELLANQKK